MPNESPGTLPVLPVLPAFLRFWKNSAIATHTNSRAGGQDYGSFNKLPQITDCEEGCLCLCACSCGRTLVVSFVGDNAVCALLLHETLTVCQLVPSSATTMPAHKKRCVSDTKKHEVYPLGTNYKGSLQRPSFHNELLPSWIEAERENTMQGDG